jgi:hypothetical protein
VSTTNFVEHLALSIGRWPAAGASQPGGTELGPQRTEQGQHLVVLPRLEQGRPSSDRSMDDPYRCCNGSLRAPCPPGAPPSLSWLPRLGAAAAGSYSRNIADYIYGFVCDAFVCDGFNH